MDTTGAKGARVQISGQRFRNKHTLLVKTFIPLPSVAHLAPFQGSIHFGMFEGSLLSGPRFHLTPIALNEMQNKTKTSPDPKTQRAPSNAAFSPILGVILIYRDVRRLPRFRIEDMAAFNGCVGRRVDCTHRQSLAVRNSPAPKH